MENNRLLTDKELDKLTYEWEDAYQRHRATMFHKTYIAQAQDSKTHKIDKVEIRKETIKEVAKLLDQFWSDGCEDRVGGIHPPNCQCGAGYHLGNEEYKLREALKKGELI